MQVAVIVLVVANHSINQMIGKRFQADALLIIGHVCFAQMLDDCCTAGDFILAEDDGVSRAAGVSALHLRFEAAQPASRCAM
jgi:hypothetical protein